jgi:hypothetical protein
MKTATNEIDTTVLINNEKVNDPQKLQMPSILFS